MRIRISILLTVAAALFLLLTACAGQVKHEEAAGEKEEVGATAKLIIAFDYEDQSGTASNQFAVWLEDMDGSFVKTIFVTRFIAGGGYNSRPEAIPTWVERSGLGSTGESDFDASTGATPKPGSLTYELDLTGPDGNVIPPGKYRFFVEGNLRWENRVVYSGEIELGGNEQVTVQGEPEFIYKAAGSHKALTADSKENAMIGPVTATYLPAAIQ